MDTLKYASVGVAVSLAVGIAGCATDVQESPPYDDSTASTDDGVASSSEPSDTASADTDSTTEALRGARGGVYRGGGVARGGAARGGAVWRRGTYRGGAVYGTGGVVYGVGGVYRAGRYATAGGVWVTCDAYGNCW